MYYDLLDRFFKYSIIILYINVYLDLRDYSFREIILVKYEKVCLRIFR